MQFIHCLLSVQSIYAWNIAAAAATTISVRNFLNIKERPSLINNERNIFECTEPNPGGGGKKGPRPVTTIPVITSNEPAHIRNEKANC